MAAIEALSQQIKEEFSRRGWTLSVAESCTGGLLASSLVGPSGASDYFLGGVVSYSNGVKERVLGVKGWSIATFGAVSLPVVLQMARGAKKSLGSNWSIATSGYASGNPSGESSSSGSTGTLCLAVVGPGVEWREKRELDSSDRTAFREAATQRALEKILELSIKPVN